jgi:hypothetical protein
VATRTKSAQWAQMKAALDALRGGKGPAVKRAAEQLLELHDHAQQKGATAIVEMIESAFASGDAAAMESAWNLWERMPDADKQRLLSVKGQVR